MSRMLAKNSWIDRLVSMDARWPLQSGRITVGRLIDVVSHSPYWKDTAIFVVEDDSQDGVDHVNDRRPYRHSGSDSVQFHSQSETAHHAECPGRHQAGKGLAEGGREVFSARTQPRSGHRRSEPAQPRDLVTDTHFSKPFPGEKRIFSIRESCTWRPPDRMWISWPRGVPSAVPVSPLAAALFKLRRSRSRKRFEGE